MHFQRQAKGVLGVLECQRLHVSDKSLKPQIGAEGPSMSDHWFIFTIPTVDFKTSASLFQSPFVAFEGRGSIQLMLDEICVMRRVAEVMVDWEGLIMVDSTFDWIESTVHITEDPCRKVLK